MSDLGVPGFGRPVLSCRDRMPRARGISTYVRDGYGTFRQPKFKCGCWEMLVFRVAKCWVQRDDSRQDIYVFSLHRNPDLDDRIYLNA